MEMLIPKWLKIVLQKDAHILKKKGQLVHMEHKLLADAFHVNNKDTYDPFTFDPHIPWGENEQRILAVRKGFEDLRTKTLLNEVKKYGMMKAEIMSLRRYTDERTTNDMTRILSLQEHKLRAIIKKLINADNFSNIIRMGDHLTRAMNSYDRILNIANSTSTDLLEVLCDSIEDEHTWVEFFLLGSADPEQHKLRAFCDVLHSPNCKVSRLDLHDCSLEDGDIERITASIHRSIYIKELDLSANNFSDRGMKAIIEAVTAPANAVHTLNIGLNPLGTDVLCDLFKALEDIFCTIRHLDLRGIPINISSAIALAKALSHRLCELTHLDLRGCELGQAGTIALMEALISSHSRVVECLGMDHIEQVKEVLSERRKKQEHAN